MRQLSHPSSDRWLLDNSVLCETERERERRKEGKPHINQNLEVGNRRRGGPTSSSSFSSAKREREREREKDREGEALFPPCWLTAFLQSSSPSRWNRTERQRIFGQSSLHALHFDQQNCVPKAAYVLDKSRRHRHANSCNLRELKHNCSTSRVSN